MHEKNIELITKFLDKSKIINVKKLKLNDIANLPTSNFKFLTDADASLFLNLLSIVFLYINSLNSTTNIYQ